tara:strand:+ start:119 stop:589 length:471 start_codon:yes stop_codon:yes gene_type:complete
MGKYNININGNDETVDVPDDTPLLWVIRDVLKLTGTKFGCGKGLCGACTIHINGIESRSCQITIDFLNEDDKITTIEGLSKDGSHPVQKAWVEYDVPQCGYCQPGQIMTASGFLSRNEDPEDEEINAAMQMNICRCGTYPRIRKAILSAAKEMRDG